MNGDSAVVEERLIGVRDGELTASGSWVYVWVRDGEEALYVGATGLPPEARAWLHLHDTDPTVGRIRANHPEALAGEVAVCAFRLRSDVDRRLVKDALIAVLRGTEVAPGPEADAAQEIAARLSS